MARSAENLGLFRPQLCEMAKIGLNFLLFGEGNKEIPGGPIKTPQNCNDNHSRSIAAPVLKICTPVHGLVFHVLTKFYIWYLSLIILIEDNVPPPFLAVVYNFDVN